jgi:hypothetical protein
MTAAFAIDRRVAARLVLRAAVLWLVVRLAVAAVGGTAGDFAFRSTPAGTALVVAVVVVLVMADLRAMRDRPFLDNVGIGLPTVLTISAATALLLELAVTVGIGVLR